MSEYKIHCAIVALLDLCAAPGVIWYHPASGEHRNAITGARLKRMGVKRGVPDLAFVLPNGHAAFMEIKSRSGRLSPEQKIFRDRCADVGAPYALVKNVEDAQAILTRWGAVRLSSSSSGRLRREGSGALAPSTP